MSNIKIISMAEIDREKHIINGRHYWAVYNCYNDKDNSVNPDYLWVIKRDLETNYAFKENIYCINDDKFLFEIWYDSVCRGNVHNGYQGEHFYVEDKWFDDKGNFHKVVNKASIHDGELLD